MKKNLILCCFCLNFCAQSWLCYSLLYNVSRPSKGNITWLLMIKPQKLSSACKCNHCRHDSVLAYIFIHVWYCMGVSLLIRLVDQQWRQLAAIFYSKWYCTTSQVDVLARRFSLASNRYIVHESAIVKECQYQGMILVYLRKLMSNIFFSKVFYNYFLNFQYIIFNEKSFLQTV